MIRLAKNNCCNFEQCDKRQVQRLSRQRSGHVFTCVHVILVSWSGEKERIWSKITGMRLKKKSKKEGGCLIGPGQAK